MPKASPARLHDDRRGSRAELVNRGGAWLISSEDLLTGK
jgi:hypothetical protein